MLGANAKMSFNYHMLGVAMGSLRVNVVQGGAETLVWSRDGAQGADWNSAQVSLSQFASSQVEIMIEGVRGNNFQGDMALDNIVLDTDEGQMTPAAVNAGGTITFTFDSPNGQVDVEGLSSLFGALRLQVSPGAAAIMKTEVGESDLQRALLAIFGRRAEIIGSCSSSETEGAQCPSTRSIRNLSTIPRKAYLNSSLHVDFRIKLKFGNVKQASNILADLGKFEEGHAETLSEASKEVGVAFNKTLTAVVLKSPQPLQLKYKSIKSTTKKSGNHTFPGITGVDVADEEEEENDGALGVIFGVVGGILGVVLLLIAVVLVRYRKQRAAKKAQEVARQMSLKVDPNPDPVHDAGDAPSTSMSSKQDPASAGHGVAAMDEVKLELQTEVVSEMKGALSAMSPSNHQDSLEASLPLSPNRGEECADSILHL